MLNIIEIKDFNAPELDVYARLTEAQLLNKDHPEDGMFIAESPKVIGRALDAGYTPVSVLAEQRQLEENDETRQVLRRYENTDIPIYTADFDVLAKLTGFKLTRGMLCAMHRRPLQNYLELCAGKSRIAILENVMNPTNVGAIFRSAAALHMEAVLLTPGCSDPLYRRASRVSMGTVFQVPWTKFDEKKEPWPEGGKGFCRAEDSHQSGRHQEGGAEPRGGAGLSWFPGKQYHGGCDAETVCLHTEEAQKRRPGTLKLRLRPGDWKGDPVRCRRNRGGAGGLCSASLRRANLC